MKRLKKNSIDSMTLQKVFKKTLAYSNVNKESIPYNEVLSLIQSDSKWNILLDETKYKRTCTHADFQADRSAVAYYFKRETKYFEVYGIDVFEFQNIETGQLVCAVVMTELDLKGHATNNPAELMIINDSAKSIVNRKTIDGLTIGCNSGDATSFVPILYDMLMIED